jgi:hypothetical protein
MKMRTEITAAEQPEQAALPVVVTDQVDADATECCATCTTTTHGLVLVATSIDAEALLNALEARARELLKRADASADTLVRRSSRSPGLR